MGAESKTNKYSNVMHGYGEKLDGNNNFCGAHITHPLVINPCPLSLPDVHNSCGVWTFRGRVKSVNDDEVGRGFGQRAERQMGTCRIIAA